MPSSVGHAAVAVLLAPVLARADRKPAVVGVAAVVAVAVDVDAIGRLFGAGDIAMLGGHRGITHSVLTAVILAGICVAALRRRVAAVDARLWTYFVLVIASHGVLDVFTEYGEGVALLAPLSAMRWKSDWQPFDDLWPEMIALWVPAWLMLWHARESPGLDRRRIHRHPGRR